MAVRKRENAQKNKKLVKRTDKKVQEQPSSVSYTKFIVAAFVVLLLFFFNRSSPAPVAKSTSRFQSGPAIVTTWKGVSREWAESWISYHAALGFTRLFIFWDAPENDKETIAWLNSDPAYSWVVDNYEPDADYKKRFWMPNNESDDFEQWVLPAYGVHAETEITARQSLFAARAAQIGLAEGVSWLLHIDADELFWVDEKEASGSAKRIFETLSVKRFTHASFMNDEILPETPNFENEKLPKTPFHQRTLFKRSSSTTFSQESRAVGQEWKAEHDGVNFFMGYMCGKGAVNLQEYNLRNPGAAVVPQHVVRFASDFRNLGLITLLKTLGMSYEHFEVPVERYQSAAHFYKARIIHYINSDLDSARSKFGFREKFDSKIFDAKLATEEERTRFDLWKKNWTEEEGMPSDVYYNNMWKAVQEEKKTGKNQAELYYKKTSLVSPKKLNRYLQAGAIYRNNDIRDYLLKLSKELHSSSSPGELLKAHNSRAATSKHKYSTCSRAPHFQCDHKDCCFHLRSPMFTFEKRLLGYIRYDSFEWWKKGITWPPRSQH